ncbi:hypothetical protein GH5_01554 [Leishmania sp. Ghana 2012 LV757]|uniref:hypothetical protein n=1 Tax=Leishmania sp. Ghana 2012 LV757 TaxID=2803181 RepID=UPI001B5460BB|nr:hypothetical protein GH5_01554 [Leishmania sp. Ghana 2012 LV757]
MHGAVRRLMPKEAFYPLEKFARNRDTKIVACAHYFAIDPAAARDGSTQAGEDSSSSQSFAARCVGCTKSFFAANDSVQRFKASAYDIPTTDTRTLKKHFGHLSVYELQDARGGYFVTGEG